MLIIKLSKFVSIYTKSRYHDFITLFIVYVSANRHTTDFLMFPYRPNFRFVEWSVAALERVADESSHAPNGPELRHPGIREFYRGRDGVVTESLYTVSQNEVGRWN